MLFKKMLFSAETQTADRSRGRGVSIAVLDTGISPVSDFILPKNRILAFLDLVNGKTDPYDDNGHGTHVMVPFQNFHILHIFVLFRVSF